MNMNSELQTPFLEVVKPAIFSLISPGLNCAWWIIQQKPCSFPAACKLGAGCAPHSSRACSRLQALVCRHRGKGELTTSSKFALSWLLAITVLHFCKTGLQFCKLQSAWSREWNILWMCIFLSSLPLTKRQNHSSWLTQWVALSQVPWGCIYTQWFFFLQTI